MITKHLSVRLSPDVRATITELAEAWGVTQTQVIERAVYSIGRSPDRAINEIIADLQEHFSTITVLFAELEQALNARDGEPLPPIPVARKRGHTLTKKKTKENIEANRISPPM